MFGKIIPPCLVGLKGATLQNLQYDTFVPFALLLVATTIAMTIEATRFRRALD